MVQSKALRPDWLPAVALSCPARRRDAGMGPTGRRPRRPGLPHRALPARRPLDLERQLVRRPLHAHLQRPLPAARLAARAAGWSARSRSSPPPTSSTAWCATAGASAARWATLWFAAGVVTLLADGQLTFALGVAFGLASLRCLQLGRGEAGAGRRRGLRPLEPGRRGLPRRRGPGRGAGAGEAAQPHRRLGPPRLRSAWSCCPTSPSPSRASSPSPSPPYVAIPLWCGAALYVTRGLRREERQLRWVIAGYSAGLDRASGWPEPDGRQRGAPRGPLRRAGAGRGGAGAPAARSRLWFLASSMAGGLYWQVTASVSADRSQRRRPLDLTAATSSRRPSGCASTPDRDVRVEVPPTANHWESAYLASQFELARGWLRQLDTTRDDIFYGDEELLTARHLRPLAAPERDLLRRPARRAARLLLGRRAAADPQRDRPTSTCAGARRTGGSTRSATPSPWSSRSGAGGGAGALGRTRRASSSTVNRPGDFLVRVNFTPYWSIARGAGCLIRHGDWTVARAAHPGVFRVAADFSVGSAWNAVTGARKTC